MRCGRFVWQSILVAGWSGLAVAAPAGRERSSDASYASRSVMVNGRAFGCQVVTLNWKGRLQPRVLIPSGGLGRTEAFEEMARRGRAVAAVNGSFFAAYKTSGDKDPDMTLIRNGQIIHKGIIGSVTGFGPHGAVMGRLDLPIRGIVETDSRRTSWYAYWINRTPTGANSVTIFTPARGARMRVSGGMSVVVREGVVEQITEGDTAIPASGFVIHLLGKETSWAGKFSVGAKVSYEVLRNPDSNVEKWQEVAEAVGAGPRLVTDGQITYDPEGEGFSDPKILSMAGRRSAIGITRDEKILLVVASGATVREMAGIMKQLGAYQAMNLDGGASSGLYCNNSVLVKPGRLLSNALIFCRP
jgi:rhodanese-related sulfurtransferase